MTRSSKLIQQESCWDRQQHFKECFRFQNCPQTISAYFRIIPIAVHRFKPRTDERLKRQSESAKKKENQRPKINIHSKRKEKTKTEAKIKLAPQFPAFLKENLRLHRDCCMAISLAEEIDEMEVSVNVSQKMTSTQEVHQRLVSLPTQKVQQQKISKDFQ